MKPFPGMADHRCLATYPPRRSGVKVGSHPALIREKPHGPFLFRQGTKLGKIALDPFLDQCCILLERSAQRLLASQSHLRQQPPHRDDAELDAILALDQRADHRPPPQREWELPLHWILRCHRLVNPSQLRSRQPLRSPARLARAKRVPSAGAVRRQPNKYSRRINTELSRYRGRCLSGLHGLNCSEADRFQLRMAQLAAVDLHESNHISPRANVNNSRLLMN